MASSVFQGTTATNTGTATFAQQLQFLQALVQFINSLTTTAAPTTTTAAPTTTAVVTTTA